MYKGIDKKNRQSFYVLVITQTLSLIGSRLTSVGMGIWLFQTTGNATPLLMTAFFNELPGMLAGSIAGIFVDRWDRRKVLILADTGQAFGSILLLASLLSGQFQVWHLYLVSLMQGSFSIFQQPAEDASITMLVNENHRDRANAIRQMAFPLAGVVATALAGILYVWVGIQGLIVIDLATFLLAIIGVFVIHIPRPMASIDGATSRGKGWQEWLAGFRFLRKNRILLIFLLYLAIINFMLNGPLGLDIPYLLLRTGDEKLASGLLALMSLGAFAGAGLVAIRGKIHNRVMGILFGSLLTGGMFLIFGTSRQAWLLGASLFLLMLPLPIGNTLIISLLQNKTPPDLQGRVFSIFSQLGYIGSTASFLITGRLVDDWLEPAVGRAGLHIWSRLVGNEPGSGIGLVLFVTGLVILVLTIVMILNRPIRNLERNLPDYEANELENA